VIAQEQILEDGTAQVIVHFVFREKKEDSPEVKYKIACLTTLDDIEGTGFRSGPYHRSDDPRTVTCQNCLRTGEFMQAMQPYLAHYKLAPRPKKVS
jgi:hypothetical protein